MHCSLIIPCYNEGQNLPTFFRAAVASFEEYGRSCEFIFVNDGSTDGSTEILKGLFDSYVPACANPITFTVLEFSRNFGKESAVFAGLEHSTGDYVCLIDADMQQDPEIACNMLSFLEENPDFDSVAAVQEQRKESLFLRTTKRAYYWIFNAMGEMQLLPNSSDFRVFTRQVADALLDLPERYRFSKGLFAWIGFKTHVITYHPAKRLSGSSKWSFGKLLSYGWGGILAFSTWPLKLVMYCGLAMALISAFFLLLDVFERAAFGNDISATQLILYVILLMGGLQMFVMGIFGEYMAHAYIETKRRPVYLIRREFTKAIDPDVEK